MTLSKRINRGIADKFANDILFLDLPIMEALILFLKMRVHYSLGVHKRIDFQSNNKRIHPHRPDNPYHFFGTNQSPALPSHGRSYIGAKAKGVCGTPRQSDNRGEMKEKEEKNGKRREERQRK